MSRGTPTVVMSEGFKAQATFRRLGLGDILASPAEVMSAVGAALNEREPGEAQWRRVAEGGHKARSNDLVVQRLLGVQAPVTR